MSNDLNSISFISSLSSL